MTKQYTYIGFSIALQNQAGEIVYLKSDMNSTGGTVTLQNEGHRIATKQGKRGQIPVDLFLNYTEEYTDRYGFTSASTALSNHECRMLVKEEGDKQVVYLRGEPLITLTETAVTVDVDRFLKIVYRRNKEKYWAYIRKPRQRTWWTYA